jgi:hypothetical protein
LKVPGFIPWNLKCDILVSSLCFSNSTCTATTRQRYVKTSPAVRADTITETMRRKQRTIVARVPEVGSVEDKKGPSKTYREVILKPYRTGPIKRDHTSPTPGGAV